ncbi:hypothetical protein BDQ12DRAFT_683409 [Crucibulum laeve]|uniref:Uncharacterized protein n=1 Tax=Crucibulum laeve TaxID=68775 RepID=A0A5C3M1F6_9AGAR|nr:hypothetical protein BDQ12DRAFT_683409 [Crucibulum laeve]
MSEFNPSPEAIRERSTNKLARTLGDLPPEAIYERLLKERQENFDSLPRIITSNLAANDRTLRISRRASLASFGSFSSFLLPSSRRRDVSSQHSVSTLTDDVHQFGLTDDLSESWGEMRDDSSRAGFRAESPTSPIVFSPPTPVANAPPAGIVNTPSAASFNSTAPSSEDAENLSLPSPSLNRSHSYSHSSRKRGERTHIHSASVPRRPDTPFDMYTLPVKSNWMNPSPTVEQDEETTPVTMKAPELVEGNGWRGEWNRTNMQDVIKTLRSLK